MLQGLFFSIRTDILSVASPTPNSEKAKTLADIGAEIVQGDLTIPSTLPQCAKGAWRVFAVTEFYGAVCFSAKYISVASCLG